MGEIMFKVSKHAIERGLERMFGVCKDDITDNQYAWMEKLLLEHIRHKDVEGFVH